MIGLRRTTSAIAALALWACAVASAGNETVYQLPAGDAVIRRTDSTNNGPLLAGVTLPDLIRISVGGWLPTSPATDPYVGTTVSPSSAHLFRLRLTFQGLVNPPGQLGLGGLDYQPYEFGKSPVYGFIELDVDDCRNTGGELMGSAPLRPLANASRFGAKFAGSAGWRQVIMGSQVTLDWQDQPQFARSGADFSLVLCGCFPVTVVSPQGAVNFTSGSTWVVRGRFFQRAGGYVPASLMDGGSGLGTYDPMVNLQFRHDVGSNTTTVTLVYPLDQIGAGMLAGHAPEAINLRADDDTSIEEGVTDLINRAGLSNLPALTHELIQRWEDESVEDSLDPTHWKIKALVGTAYSSPSDGLYIWTDVGVNCLRGDVNGDGVVNSGDRTTVQAFIADRDGGPDDNDEEVNGCFTLKDFGWNYCLFDLGADGLVNHLDVDPLPYCPGDWNQSGMISVDDVFYFLADWFRGFADFNGNNGTTIQDIFDFLAAYFGPC